MSVTSFLHNSSHDLYLEKALRLLRISLCIELECKARAPVQTWVWCRREMFCTALASCSKLIWRWNVSPILTLALLSARPQFRPFPIETISFFDVHFGSHCALCYSDFKMPFWVLIIFKSMPCQVSYSSLYSLSRTAIRSWASLRSRNTS